jgi:hypothetical protein
VRLDDEPNTAFVPDLQFLTATKQLDASSRDLLLYDLGRVTVFARQNALRRLYQEYFGTQLRQRLSHFAAERPGANDAESFRLTGSQPSHPLHGGGEVNIHTIRYFDTNRSITGCSTGFIVS